MQSKKRIEILIHHKSSFGDEYKGIERKSMNYKDLRSKWNKRVDVVRSSFKKYNLMLNSYGFTDFQDDGTMTLLVELSTIEGKEIDEYVMIKVNFYDEDGAIIYSIEEEIDEGVFSGYDTLRIALYEEGLAFDAIKCRIYVTQE